MRTAAALFTRLFLALTRTAMSVLSFAGSTAHYRPPQSDAGKEKFAPHNAAWVFKGMARKSRLEFGGVNG